MNEIKIRGWDGERMYYATLEDLIFSMGSQGAGDHTLEEEVGEELVGFAGQLRSGTEMIYMLSIGQRDTQGKEIFDGDLVRWEEGKKEYRVVYDKEWASFIGVPVDGSRGWHRLDKTNTYTIIGHIHQKAAA